MASTSLTFSEITDPLMTKSFQTMNFQDFLTTLEVNNFISVDF